MVKNEELERIILTEEIKAPISGEVVSIKVEVGDEVNQDDVLIVLEAMKMENEITSPINGKVKDINVKENQKVENDEVLIEIE